MSPIATRLYRYLRYKYNLENVTMEELTHHCRASKTAVRAAIAELEVEHLLTYEQLT